MLFFKNTLAISLVAILLSVPPSAQALSIIAEHCTQDPAKRDNFLNWHTDYDSYCVYEYYNDDYAIGKKGDKYAIYDILAKKQLTDFVYDDIRYFNKGSNNIDRVFIIKQAGKWGTLDTLGNKKMFEGDFDTIDKFTEGVTIATKNHKSGVIDLNGKVIVPLEYGYMNPFSHGFTNVKKDGKATFIDNKGKLLTPFIYDEVSYFGENGLSAVYDKKLHKLALINTQGKLVSPFIYDDVKITQEPVTIVMKDNKLGLVDNTGKLIVPIEYEGTIPPGGDIGFSNHMITVKDTRTNKYGMFNNRGEVVVPFVYDDDFWLYDNIILVKKAGKQGFLDSNFKVIVPIDYDYANYEHNGLLRVVKANKTGFYDTSGKLIIPVIYNIEENADFKDGKIKASLNGQSVYLDTKGKRVK